MRAFLGGFGLGVVSRGSAQIAALLFSILAARFLGRQDFGAYAIGSVLVVFVQAILYGGIYDFIVRGRGQAGDVDTPFWVNLLFGVLGGSVILGLAPVFGHLMHLPSVTKLMLALAPSSLLAAFASWSEAVLLRRSDLRIYYSLSIAGEITACAIAVAGLWSGAGIWSFVLYRYAQLCLCATLNTCVTRSLPRARFNREVARDALRFANRINGSRVIGLLAGYAPDLLIGFFAGAAETASYRLANRVVTGVSDVLFVPVGKQAWVTLAAHADDEAARGRVWTGLMQALALVVWPALCGVAILDHSLIDVLVGRRWSDAAPVLGLIAIARMFHVFEVFLEPMLGVCDRAGTILRVNTFLSVVSLLAFCVLARFGAMGGGAVQLLVGILSAALSIRFCLRQTPVSPRHLLLVLIPSAVGASLAVIASLMANASVQTHSPSVRMAAAVAAAIVLWSFGLASINRMTKLLQPLRAMSASLV